MPLHLKTLEAAAERAELTPETKVELLLKIAHSVMGTLDLDEVLHHLLDSIRPFVNYDAAGIFVLKQHEIASLAGPWDQLIAGVAQIGYGEVLLDGNAMLNQGKGIVGHSILTGEIAIVPDVREDGRYVMVRERTLSEITVPILREGLPLGALNLESDGLSAFGEEDAAVLRFFADAAAISIVKAMLHGQILEKNRMGEQMRLAQEVQARLLPAGPPVIPGYDIAEVYIPSYEVGGDYYDHLDLPGGKTGFVVADVSGKGIPAALIMATVRTLVRTLAHHAAGPCELARTLNHTLRESVASSSFVTAVYGVLDPATGRFEYVNCGHNPPIHVLAGGETVQLHSNGPLLGVIEDAVFTSGSCVLAPGDRLVMYTDGVVECQSRPDEEFGLPRLVETVLHSGGLPPAGVIQKVIKATRDFTGKERYRDDFTMVVIARASKA